jgi:hypothetical protein
VFGYFRGKWIRLVLAIGLGFCSRPYLGGGVMGWVLVQGLVWDNVVIIWDDLQKG